MAGGASETVLFVHDRVCVDDTARNKTPAMLAVFKNTLALNTNVMRAGCEKIDGTRMTGGCKNAGAKQTEPHCEAWGAEQVLGGQGKQAVAP